MAERKFWWNMDNGKQAEFIRFVAYVRNALGAEVSFQFKAANPPLYATDPNSFTRLSFETLKEFFARAGHHDDIGHVIWGEVSEGGSVRSTYVFRRGEQVPFAVVVPTVFEAPAARYRRRAQMPVEHAKSGEDLIHDLMTGPDAT